MQATAAGALGVDPGDLRAALAWNIYSDELLECLDDVDVDGPLDFTSDSDTFIAQQLQLCWSFSERGRVETASVAIEPSFPASFTIPVEALPDPSLLSGGEGARLGIADLLVYSDDNGSGVFEETARGENAFADRVQGTSLPVGEEDLDGAWVVYREGELAPIFKIFEALYGCRSRPSASRRCWCKSRRTATTSRAPSTTRPSRWRSRQVRAWRASAVPPIRRPTR